MLGGGTFGEKFMVRLLVMSVGKRSIQHGAIGDSRLVGTWTENGQPHSNVDPKQLRYQARRQVRVAYVPLKMYNSENYYFLGGNIYYWQFTDVSEERTAPFLGSNFQKCKSKFTEVYIPTRHENTKDINSKGKYFQISAFFNLVTRDSCSVYMNIKSYELYKTENYIQGKFLYVCFDSICRGLLVSFLSDSSALKMKPVRSS